MACDAHCGGGAATYSIADRPDEYLQVFPVEVCAAFQRLRYANRFHAACRDTASACPIVAQLTSRSRRLSTISCIPGSTLSNAPLYPARVFSKFSVGASSGNSEPGGSFVPG